MSEEVNNAVIVVPQSVMLGMLLNGTLGFSMILAVLFCMGQLPEESQTGFPFMDIFLNATKSPAGATAMSSIIILMCFCATVGVFTSTSRILWSFARDHGVPFWRTLSKVLCSTFYTFPMRCKALIPSRLTLVPQSPCGQLQPQALYPVFLP